MTSRVRDDMERLEPSQLVDGSVTWSYPIGELTVSLTVKRTLITGPSHSMPVDEPQINKNMF